MALNRTVNDWQKFVGHQIRQSNQSDVKRASSRNANDDFFQQTVDGIVATIAKKNNKLNITKSFILQPIATEKVREAFNKMSIGMVLAAYEIETITAAVYKEALWQVHQQDSNSPYFKQSQTTIKKQPFFNLQEEFHQPKVTSLEGFRNFTINQEWESEIKKSVKSQIKNLLDQQHDMRISGLINERNFQHKLDQEAHQLHLRKLQMDSEKRQAMKAQKINTAQFQLQQAAELQQKARHEFDLQQTQERVDLGSVRVVSQDMEFLRDKYQRKDWARQNAEDLIEQMKSNYNQFEKTTKMNNLFENKIVKEQGFRHLNSKKPQELQKLGQVMPNSFYLDKTKISAPFTTKQQVALEHSRALFSAQMDRNRREDDKIEMQAKGLLMNWTLRDFLMKETKHQRAKSMAITNLQQTSDRIRNLENEATNDKAWLQTLKKLDKKQLTEHREQVQELRRRTTMNAATQLQQLGLEKQKRLGESIMLL